MTISQDPRPVACNLGAFTVEQRERHKELLQRLRGAFVQVSELHQGYTFRYPADRDLFMAAAEFITLESLCCSFFKFNLEWSPIDHTMTLSIIGPEGAKAIILGALGASRS